ncbi:MAG: type II toxin-antitoxin system VapC family toxin [Sulfurimonas sp.]|nr:type II toxin-antitoxin system VapC family toxin [Sulfurimonas sp.]
MKFCFIDSCIVIDYINAKLPLTQKQLDSCCFNSIVDMEVLVGANDKRDLNTINKKLSEFTSVDINQNILTLARALMNKYSLSHNMGIYDAIIAATCLVYELPLWTYNKKDFRFINGLELIDGC